MSIRFTSMVNLAIFLIFYQDLPGAGKRLHSREAEAGTSARDWSENPFCLKKIVAESPGVVSASERGGSL